MGCENPTSKEDADLIMASGSISALHITTLPPPEIQNEGLDNFPFELKHALRGKLLNQCGINSKFNEITTEEFDLAFNHNYYANEILNLYKSKIDIIKYEPDTKYQNVNPIKIIDGENNTQYYKGGFNDKGQAHGRGIWIKDFNIYVGNFKNDNFNGMGLFINEQGDYYFGEWKNSLYDGFGSLIVGKKLAYRGFFKNGKKEGIGEEKTEEGNYYSGEFYNGEKSGKGEYHFSDGTNYVGNFRNSKYSGFGNIDLGKDEYAIGAFKDGKFDGTMKLGLGEGDTFEGNYAENMKMGEGRYSWKDGTKYKGFWKDDVAIGTAVYTDPTTGNSENMIITS
jgi:hypothetical protein